MRTLVFLQLLKRNLIRYVEDPTVAEEEYQKITNNKLERLFRANGSNHNELVSATALIYKGIVDPKLDGLLFISKRVNVLEKQKKIIKADSVNSKYSDADFTEKVE